MFPTIERLRAHAVRRSLFPPISLKAAIRRLGFVQADPIRSPARAQDLILRHRVKDYRAGDLERLYPKLDVEEDMFYAYGFLPRAYWQLLHPRQTKELTDLDRRVLSIVRGFGAMHPRDLEEHLGRERAINPWGGYSKATTRSLEALHYHGLLRIVRREEGIRIYEPAPPLPEAMSPRERLVQLVLLLVRVFEPVPRDTLRELLRRMAYAAPGLERRPVIIDSLLQTGELCSTEIEGMAYICLPTRLGQYLPGEVRLLAPFDPIVWDRRRLEHLWGWRYRFEAYTPVSKRKLGYYAMPVLWGTRIWGWANVAVQAGTMRVKFGWIEKRPKDAEFGRALDEEIERMRVFLGTT